MARLAPSEIIESPEDREAALKKQVRLLKDKVKRREKAISRLREKSPFQEYSVHTHSLREAFTGEFRMTKFKGQCAGGTAMLFYEAKLEDCIFAIDGDDHLIFKDSYLKDVHFNTYPRSVLLINCVLEGVTSGDDWVNVCEDTWKLDPFLVENMGHKCNSNFSDEI